MNNNEKFTKEEVSQIIFYFEFFAKFTLGGDVAEAIEYATQMINKYDEYAEGKNNNE